MQPPLNWRFVGLYAAYVASLHAFDGPWKRWPKGRAVDPWTLTHVAWGAVAHRMGLSRSQIMVLGIVNEIGEALVRRHRPDLLWGTPEGPYNTLVDLAANVVGYELARRVA